VNVTSMGDMITVHVELMPRLPDRREGQNRKLITCRAHRLFAHPFAAPDATVSTFDSRTVASGFTLGRDLWLRGNLHA
jgi:hypothetical protein